MPAFADTNQHAKIVADFENRIAAYVKIHNQAESGLPALKPTQSPDAIDRHERELADKIRQLRTQAKQGDIFTQPITAEFRRLFRIASSGSESRNIHRSLQHSEPVAVIVHVNDAYPAAVPLQSTPAALLRNLPRLPKQVEYRVIGHNLILRDTGANLVIDIAEQVVF
jgi:hypothetical protein